MNRKLILIGGMPTAGKTTIAKKLARHYDVPYISTDQIRIIMQSIADPIVYPHLFSTRNRTAEEFLSSHTVEEIAELEYAQAREVWVGIQHFIERDWVWDRGYIIEGVALIPSLVATLSNKHDYTAVFLSDVSHDRIKKVVYSRGLFDDARTYSDKVKDKEVEWVKVFDKKVRWDAQENGFAVIDIKKDDDDVRHILSIISG